MNANASCAQRAASRWNVAVLHTGTLLAVALLTACGGGGASEPPIAQVFPPTSTKLQFAVGVATISYNGGQSVAYGLNTVSTLRQPNGLSGTLYNIPKVVGPTHFDVFTSTETGNQVLSAGADLGTNHITWATLNQPLWTGPPRGLKAASTGVFGYGLCPCNADAGPVNGTPSLYHSFNLPIYGNDEELFYGGPPAFPAVDPSVRAVGFFGYSLGFTDFAVEPVLGTYRISVAVPPTFTQPGQPTPTPGPQYTPTPPPPTIAANAQLASFKPLPALPIPQFSPDGKGGGTISLAVPAGLRETAVFVRTIGASGTGACATARAADAFFTIVTHAVGLQRLKLDDALGPAYGSTASTQTICPQASYQIYAAGFDYPAYESSYPSNLAELPVIRALNGQADVTTSDVLNGAYP